MKTLKTYDPPPGSIYHDPLYRKGLEAYLLALRAYQRWEATGEAPPGRVGRDGSRLKGALQQVFVGLVELVDRHTEKAVQAALDAERARVKAEAGTPHKPDVKVLVYVDGELVAG